MSDDQRAAVGISVTLSGQLMAAALAIIAVEAGFVSYVLANRTTEWFYYLISSVAFIVFAASLYCGGSGINEARNEGYKGNWNLESGRGKFNAQAIFCLLGLLFLFVSLFISGERKDLGVTADIARLTEILLTLRQEVHDQRRSEEGVLQDLKAIHVFEAEVSKKLLTIQEQLSRNASRVCRRNQHKVVKCN